MTVKISSLEQLESAHDGILAVYSLEKMSTAYNGISLNKLIMETRKLFLLGEEEATFMSKVALQGYEYNDYYDEFVYEISDYRKYRVSDDFPRLTCKNVDPAITKASYEIALIEIEKFIEQD
jgi:hypothetical protein